MPDDCEHKSIRWDETGKGFQCRNCGAVFQDTSMSIPKVPDYGVPAPDSAVKEDDSPSACMFLKNASDTLEARGREYNKTGQERSMKAIVEAFNAVTGHKLTTTEGWKFMVLLKLVRLSASPGHRDSAVDLVGYSALTAEESQKPKTD